jgi:hypothetical protein
MRIRPDELVRSTYRQATGPGSVARLLAGATLAGLLWLTNPAPAQSPTGGPKALPLMDREQEIALALGACPAPVAAKAAVYVLAASGYVKVRDSQNGFTAIVQHSLPTTQEPQCMDAEGTRTLLPRMLKVAELRAQGKPPEEIKRIIAEGYAKGTFQPPARPGIDYMLSTEILTPNDKGEIERFPPHVMCYAPYLTNADLGLDGRSSGPIFVAAEGTPSALIIVPVAVHSNANHAQERP